MQRESLKYYTRRYKRAGREGKKGKDGEREKMRPPPLSAKEKSLNKENRVFSNESAGGERSENPSAVYLQSVIQT